MDDEQATSQVIVEELRLINFRAFKNARLVLSPLLTFIIGHNGSGKSSLLDGFEFMRSSLSDGLTVASKSAGGMPSIGRRQPKGRPANPAIAIAMRINGYRVVYGFKLRVIRSAGSGFNVEEEVLATEDGKHSYAVNDEGFTPSLDVEGIKSTSVPDNRSALRLPQLIDYDPLWRTLYNALTGINAYSISPSMVRNGRVGQVEINRLRRMGDNVGDVLWSLQHEGSKEDLRWIVDRLSAVVPDIVDLSVQDRKTEYEIHFRQGLNGKSNNFTAFDMSDGTLRSLAILLALKQKPTPTMVLIDEIEDSIHPQALSVLLGAAEVSSEHFQVVITSHSPEVLDYSAVKGENVRVVEWWDGASWIYPLHDKVIAILGPRHRVGDMLTRNSLRAADEPDRINEKSIFDPNNYSEVNYRNEEYAGTQSDS